LIIRHQLGTFVIKFYQLLLLKGLIETKIGIVLYLQTQNNFKIIVNIQYRHMLSYVGVTKR